MILGISNFTSRIHRLITLPFYGYSILPSCNAILLQIEHFIQSLLFLSTSQLALRCLKIPNFIPYVIRTRLSTYPTVMGKSRLNR